MKLEPATEKRLPRRNRLFPNNERNHGTMHHWRN